MEAISLYRPEAVNLTLAAFLAGVSPVTMASWSERGLIKLAEGRGHRRVSLAELERVTGRRFNDTDLLRAEAQRREYLKRQEASRRHPETRPAVARGFLQAASEERCSGSNGHAPRPCE